MPVPIMVCRVCGKEYVEDQAHLEKHGMSMARKHICSFECFGKYVSHEQEYSDEGSLVHENYLRWRHLDYLIEKRKKPQQCESIEEVWNSMSHKERKQVIRTERTGFCNAFIEEIVDKLWKELDENTRKTLTIIDGAGVGLREGR